MKNKLGMAGVKQLLRVQLIVSAVIALTFFLAFGKEKAISSILGAIVGIVPTLLFAKKLFQYRGARDARKIVKSFYLGEALKIISSVALFALVFLLFKISPIAFFFTYIAVLMTHWFAPLFFVNNKLGQKSD